MLRPIFHVAKRGLAGVIQKLPFAHPVGLLLLFSILTAIFPLLGVEAVQLTLTSGEVICGEIEQKEIPFLSNHGKLNIKIEGIESFSNNQLKLKDGSIFNGSIANTKLTVRTPATTLTIKSNDIVNIASNGKLTTQETPTSTPEPRAYEGTQREGMHEKGGPPEGLPHPEAPEEFLGEMDTQSVSQSVSQSVRTSSLFPPSCPQK